MDTITEKNGYCWILPEPARFRLHTSDGTWFVLDQKFDIAATKSHKTESAALAEFHANERRDAIECAKELGISFATIPAEFQALLRSHGSEVKEFMRWLQSHPRARL